jgi:Interferon-induced transmembrane protein
MADDSGPPRSKYPPPKPPSPTTGYPPSPAPPQSPQQQQPPRQPQGHQPQQAYQPQPGYRPDAARPSIQPPARWPLTIISFLCFFLVGIIAMYFSAQVGTRWRTGNTAGAEKASQMALVWGIAGIVIGLIVFFAAVGSDSTGY